MNELNSRIEGLWAHVQAAASRYLLQRDSEPSAFATGSRIQILQILSTFTRLLN